MTSQPKQVKCVVVGDGAVGKTCMLISYVENQFPSGVVPTVYDNFEASILVHNEEVHLSLWDTANNYEPHSRVRCLAYDKTDVFLLCFSIANRASFKNVEEFWIPEIRHNHLKNNPTTPIILVGTKTDLRASLNGDLPGMVTAQEGHTLAIRINAVGYKECSAKLMVGLKDIFDTAMMTALYGSNVNSRQEKNKTKCVLF